MEKSKLFSLLKHLIAGNKASLNEYMHSTYHNRERKVVELYQWLVDHIDEIQPLEPWYVFKALYPNDAYNDGRLRYLKTQLTRTLERFILLESSLRDNQMGDVYLLHYFRDHDLHRQFRLQESRIRRNWDQKKVRSASYYHARFAFNWERQNYYADQKRTDVLLLQELNQNLDLYYLIRKLQIACTIYNAKNLYENRADLPLMEPLIAYVLEEDLAAKHPLLAIYLNAFLLIKDDGDPRSYYQLKDTLLDQSASIDPSDLKEAMVFALNFCIQQLNKGNQSFLEEIFELYQWSLEVGLLLDSGEQISPITYSNIVTTGLRLKKFEVTLKFIEEYKVRLSSFDAAGFYAFNLSKVHFEKGEYEKVIQLFNDSVVKELLIDIQIRMMQIKAFYEMGEYVLCQNLNDNLQQLLTRKDILAYHKENYRNITRFMKRLLNVNVYDQAALLRLRKRLEQQTTLTEKEWLTEKVDQLLN